MSDRKPSFTRVVKPRLEMNSKPPHPDYDPKKSVVILLPDTTADMFYNHNDAWNEIYSVQQVSDSSAICGTHYCTGSGVYFIHSNDNRLYSYTCKWTSSETIAYAEGQAVLLLLRVKQSNVAHIDDVITYCRIVKM